MKPIYAGRMEDVLQFPQIKNPKRRRQYHHRPLGLALTFAQGFADNACDFCGLTQAQVIAHTPPILT